MAALLLISMSCTQKETNPLLKDFTTPHHTPPFDLIKTGDYIPAFDVSIEAAKKEIEQIASSAEAPDFQNTIVALDAAGEKLGRVSAIFFNLNSANTNDEMQKIAQEVSPKLTEFSNSIYMNPQLFERVKQVYENKANLNLNPEQTTLLEDTWKSFINGGANLEGEAKERFKAISMELSGLGF